jgi:hypothetical protein
MNKELIFFLKVLRNGFILSVAYFFSVYASNEILTYAVLKPVLIFLGTYISAELINRYKLQAPSERKNQVTFIF